MGCLFPKPDADSPTIDTIEDVTTKQRKSRVKSNRFVVEDKKRRKAKSVRLRKNSNNKSDRTRKVQSVKIVSKKRTRSRAKTAADSNLPKCHVCSRPANVMYGSGRRVIVKQYGTFKKKTLVFCSKEHAPSCANCDGDNFDSAIVKNLDEERENQTYYCSDKCYSRKHRVRESVVKGTEKAMGVAKAEMMSTEFENDFEEVMRKVAPILSATMQVPTCRYCRCPFQRNDTIQIVGALKAHMDCAARGQAVYVTYVYIFQLHTHTTTTLLIQVYTNT